MVHTTPIVITYLITDTNLDRLIDLVILADRVSQVLSSSMVHAIVDIVSLIAITLLIAIVIFPLTVSKSP